MADALIERLDRTIELVMAGRDATAALADAELAPLAVVAGELRWCPSQAFKARLRADLERRTAMTMVQETTSVREGFTTVTPYVRVRDAGLAEFLTTVFGAVQTSVVEGGAGVHREMRVGDSMMMIGEGGADDDPSIAPAAFHIFVPDVDAAYDRAIAAGAKSMGAPEDRSYGERSGFVEDPFGNHWYIAAHLGDTPVPQGHHSVTPFIHPRGGSASYIDFLARAFGAVEEFRHDVQGAVMHARVRIGDGAVEMGDGAQVERLKPAFYLYVADCEALYRRTLAAGATSLSEPVLKPYGERVATVQDPTGITWYLATPV